jgi:GTP-binding protein Era
MGFKSGFVAILGRPNAGKSTLLNALVGQKVAIVSPHKQTTRNRILGIVNRPGAQIVFADTPGLHKPDSILGRHMMQEVHQALEGTEILLLLVDATHKFGSGDQFDLDLAGRFPGKRFLLPNKIDLLRKDRLLPLMEFYSRKLDFTEIIPISALTSDGLDRLLERIVEHLPECPPYFPEDQFTDQPERFLAAEIIREKVLAHTRREVPHAVAVLTEGFEEGPKLTRIQAIIYVEREGQKGIVIGRGGAMLKTIGTEARLELEELLDRKIFLELFVKVRPDWRGESAVVRQLDWRQQLVEMIPEEETGEEGSE